MKVEPNRVPSAPSRILIIDDDEDHRRLSTVAILKQWPNADVTVARDGHEALQLLDKWYEAPVDLIFLDIQIPGMHGQEFLATWYRSRNFAEPPVIVLSTISEEQRQQLALYRCVRGFLAKPLTAESLAAFCRPDER